MFHSEGNKGGSFSDCWCITDICICRSEIGSKTIGMDVWTIMGVMISRLWLEIVSEHIIGDSERDVDWGQ